MNSSEPVRRNARIAPDAAAIERVDGSTITYRELDHTIDALAHRVRGLGVQPGQVAAIVTADSYR